VFPLTGWGEPRSSFPQPVTPPSVDPDTGGLVSISFNPAWLPYVLGALTQLTQRTTWSGSDADITLAVDRATNLMNLIGAPSISVPGVTVTITPIIRYNSTSGNVETSTDGGSTWVATPAADPRNQTTLPPQTGVNANCNSAVSERKYLERWSGMLSTYGGTALTATGLAYNALGLLLMLSGDFAIIADVVVNACLGLASAGLTALQLAFDSTNLDILECIIYCNTYLSVIDSAALGRIDTDIDAQIGGTSATILKAVLALQGVGGINQAMALKLGTGTCTGCGCDWCYHFATLNTWSLVIGTLQGDGSILATKPGTSWAVEVQLVVTLAAGSHITSVQGNYTQSSNGAVVRVLNALPGINPSSISSSPGTSWNDNEMGSTTSTSVTVTVYGDTGTPNRGLKLHSITLSGTGVNPFGGNNC